MYNRLKELLIEGVTTGKDPYATGRRVAAGTIKKMKKSPVPDLERTKSLDRLPRIAKRIADRERSRPVVSNIFNRGQNIKKLKNNRAKSGISQFFKGVGFRKQNRKNIYHNHYENINARLKNILSEMDLVDYISSGPKTMSGATRAYRKNMRKADATDLTSPSKSKKWFKASKAAREALWTIPTSKERDKHRGRISARIKNLHGDK